MIQFLADNIDQLDLALDQLSLSDRNFDRFALMLIDNVVELTLHKYAQEKASENDFFVRLAKPKYNPKAVQKALGQNFESKVKFALKSNLISENQCESILYLHAFRNTSYHKGLRHEGILHSIAIFYFINTCDILAAYKPRVWSWGSNDKLSHRARKYIGEPGFFPQKEKFDFAFERLKQVASSMDHNLVLDLSSDMQSTIESADWSLDFLANDSPVKQTRNEVIIYCQAWQFAFSEEAKEFARKNSCPEKSVGDFVDWIAHNYKWQFKSDPIPSWQTRLQSLKIETDLHKALKKYCDFNRQTEGIRSKIDESAYQLDSHIQQQIDIARGK